MAVPNQSTLRSHRVRSLAVVIATVSAIASGSLASLLAANDPPPVLTPPKRGIGLGGVKAKLPRPIGSIKGTLLPPAPTTRPTPVVRPPHSGNTGGDGAAPRPPRVVDPNRDRNRNERNDRDVDRNRHDDDFRRSRGNHINGSFDDDRFRLRFHVGSGYPYYRRYPYTTYGYNTYYGTYGYPTWYSDYYDYPPGYVQGYHYPLTLDPYVAAPSSASATPAAPQRELTKLERADLALREGRSEDAVSLYREHLRQSPEDGVAMRSLALSLILDKDIKEATAVMSLAYGKQKSLASQPIRSGDVTGGKAGLRKMLNAVVPLTNRTKSASGYLTLVVLMQAEGRLDHARRMLTKARDAGLDEALAKELELAIKP